ncbi:MAG: hypothetical protein QXT14_08610 [Candidatus Bathyarchaeia archaeon]
MANGRSISPAVIASILLLLLALTVVTTCTLLTLTPLFSSKNARMTIPLGQSLNHSNVSINTLKNLHHLS